VFPAVETTIWAGSIPPTDMPSEFVPAHNAGTEISADPLTILSSPMSDGTDEDDELVEHEVNERLKRTAALNATR
jgi:hypothetical protein